MTAGVLHAVIASGKGLSPPVFELEGALQGGTSAFSHSLPAGIDTLVAARPAGTVVGLAFVETANQSVTITGWTAVTEYGSGTAGGTDASRITVFWRRMDGTETTAEVSDSGDHQIIRVAIYSNCKASGTPFQAIDGSAGSIAASPITLSTGSTSVAQVRVFLGITYSEDIAAASFSAFSQSLTGTSELWDFGATSGNGGGFAVYSGSFPQAGSLGAMSIATSRTLPQVMAHGIYELLPYGA